MTNVTYYRDTNEFSIEFTGHSGYAEHGNDIVCSAISALSQTLVAQMELDADYYDSKIDNGYLWLYAKGDCVGFALDTIITGLRLIEQSYPDYIEIEEGCTLQLYPILPY